jgi:hypothetical protein
MWSSLVGKWLSKADFNKTEQETCQFLGSGEKLAVENILS